MIVLAEHDSSGVHDMNRRITDQLTKLRDRRVAKQVQAVAHHFQMLLVLPPRGRRTSANHFIGRLDRIADVLTTRAPD
jgi:hypothetical protein